MRGVSAALAVTLALGGCATAQRGTEENVLLNSNPVGAEVTVFYFPVAEGDNTRPMADAACTTPCALPVKRNTRTAVRFTKSGFEPATVALGKRVSGEGVATSLASLTATGMLIDAASGALLDHCPNPVYVNLKPRPGTRAPKPGYIPALPDGCKSEPLAPIEAE